MFYFCSDLLTLSVDPRTGFPIPLIRQQFTSLPSCRDEQKTRLQFTRARKEPQRLPTEELKQVMTLMAGEGNEGAGDVGPGRASGPFVLVPWDVCFLTASTYRHDVTTNPLVVFNVGLFVILAQCQSLSGIGICQLSVWQLHSTVFSSNCASDRR